MKLIPPSDVSVFQIPNVLPALQPPLPSASRMRAQLPGRDGGEIPEDRNGSRKCERRFGEGGAGRRAGTEREVSGKHWSI